MTGPRARGIDSLHDVLPFALFADLLCGLLLGVYLTLLALLGLYGAHRVVTVARHRWRGKALPEPAELPPVCVQLPLFNERAVAARLIRAVGGLDYPRDRLELQVLDDSTDGTRAIVDREVAVLRAAGLDARVLRRASRAGYKAGALAAGAAAARADLFAIFDADFVPAPDFLRRLVGAFADERVGMVQARWGHANRDESWLTRAQATLLDGHFVIEHQARFERGLFFNFNGTAGLWRRAAIEAAGGWQADTLTEDLDLSYRAQLAGWRFVYAADVVAPAEVPPTLAAFQSQQHRWSRGSAQVLRKLGARILRSREPLAVKVEALAHLSSNIGYPLVLGVSLLLPLGVLLDVRANAWVGGLAFGLCTATVLAFYETSQRVIGRPLGARLADVLAAVALGIGMSVAQTRAVGEGLRRRGGEFVRTPKRGDAGAPSYPAARRPRPWLELALCAWFLVGIGAAVARGSWGTIPFLGLFLAGHGWVAALRLAERTGATESATAPA